MDTLMAAIAFSEALRNTLAKQNPGATIEETVERLMRLCQRSRHQVQTFLRGGHAAIRLPSGY